MSTPTLSRTEFATAPRLPQRAQVVAPQLRLADSPAAAVLRAAAVRGPISRDVAARATDLSIATVNRQVSALLGAGLLRERADLTASGAIGRPRVPFEVNHESTSPSEFISARSSPASWPVTCVDACSAESRSRPRGPTRTARCTGSPVVRVGSLPAGTGVNHCGSEWRSAAASMPPVASSTIRDWVGTRRASAESSANRSGCRSRYRRTSKPWRRRSCYWLRVFRR